MRFPSLNNLVGAAQSSAQRFPLVVGYGVVAAILACVTVEIGGESEWVRGLLAAQLGIPFAFALAVWAETSTVARGLRWPLGFLTVILLAAYWWSIPDRLNDVVVTRHLQFTVGLHLLVAFLPFGRAASLNGFWQYNRSLFLRFLVSAVYSAVLYAGLAIALLAIDKLLGLRIDEVVYAQLFFTIAFLVNTWLFVGGVPDDITGLVSVTDYPTGIKVFAQYILVPLVFVYLGILSAYLAKIVITQVWPSGWIGWLVSSVAAAGILAHLLIHPVRDDTSHQWVRTYARGYYLGMIPATIMLLLAIVKRVEQYGITENRYILAVLAGWLAVISVYFIFTKSRNIKAIPLTLCAIAFATSFGPWGAFAVSERSQVNRLAGILERNGMLVDGKAATAPDTVSIEDQRQVSAILDYLASKHGTESISEWFGDRWADIDTTSADPSYARRAGSDHVKRIVEELGIEYVGRWTAQNVADGNFHFNADHHSSITPLDNPDLMTRLHPGRVHNIPAHDASITWDRDRDVIALTAQGEELTADVGAWTSDRLALRFVTTQVDAEQASIVAANDVAQLTVLLERVSGSQDGDDVDVTSGSALVFIRWKN